MKREAVVATVRYADDEYVFREGDRRTFGRNDAVVDMPIWSAINGSRLSRVAGELWCQGGEMWLRNLSLAHELELEDPQGPLQEPLARRMNTNDRGVARSLPPRALVRGPDGCLLEVALERSARTAPPTSQPLDPEDGTVMPRRPPGELLPVATALCEPLLVGGATAASYNAVAARLGVARQTAIRRVERLLDHYVIFLPEWQERLDARCRREGRAAGTAGDDEAIASRASYEELALFLVRKRLIVPIDRQQHLSSTATPPQASG